MPRWPFLLPPLAVSTSTSTSPSRSRDSSLSIGAESPSCRPSPSSCRHGRAIPRRCAAPSVTLYSPSRHPSPHNWLSVHRRRAHAVPCRRGAIAPSLAVKEPSRHCRRGSIAPSICPDGCRVASPHSAALYLPVPLIAALPFVSLVRPAGYRVSSLLTPPPPICWHLRLSSHRCLLSHPSQASGPAV